VARSIPAEIRASLAAPLGRLAGLDPFTLLHKSNAASQELLNAQAKIGALRRRAVRQLRSEGYTLKEIGDELGVKPQRIHQLETGYDRTEKRERRVSS
jgi:DNA-directed RNA polymerase specialized sigma24 family protein